MFQHVSTLFCEQEMSPSVTVAHGHFWVKHAQAMSVIGGSATWATWVSMGSDNLETLPRNYLMRGVSPFIARSWWEVFARTNVGNVMECPLNFWRENDKKKLELSQHLELFEVETDSEQSVSILNQPKRCKLKIVTPWRCFILSKEFYHTKIASKFGSKHPLMVWIHHRQNASSLSGTLAPRRISQVEPLRIAFGVQECRKLHLTPYLFAGHFDGQSSRNWATSLNSNLNESLIGSRLPFSFLDKSLQAKFIFKKKSPPGSQFRWTVPGTVSEEHDAQTNSTNLAPFAQRHPWVNSAGTTAGRKTSWV